MHQLVIKNFENNYLFSVHYQVFAPNSIFSSALCRELLQNVSLHSNVYLYRKGLCHYSKFIIECIKICCSGSFVAYYHSERFPFPEVYLKHRERRQCFYSRLYNYYDYNYFSYSFNVTICYTRNRFLSPSLTLR